MVGCAASLIYYNHHAALTLAEKETRKRTKYSGIVKYGSINLITSSSMFFRITSRKKEEKKRKKTAAWSTVQSRTNWRRGLLQKAATARDRCVAHLLPRSCRDVRRPRHLPNAKTAAILQSRPHGTTKKQISYFVRVSEIPRPGRYRKDAGLRTLCGRLFKCFSGFYRTAVRRLRPVRRQRTLCGIRI